MKKLLIQSITIVHPDSKYNGKKVDVLISDGKIERIENKIDSSEKSVQILDGKGKFLGPGFFDLNVNFGEPGLETKEDLSSGCEAAAAGGFTGVAVMPDTQPSIHSKAEVSYIVNKTKDNLVDVFPLGTISYKREGKDLAELYDMSLSGAVAFTDGNNPVTDSGLMSRALLYAKGFDGLIFSHAEDPSIAGKGKMNEGVTSTYLGMIGIPALAEEIMVARDLYLAEYNDSPIHFSTISTLHSVDLIRQAKKKGLKVTCDVAVHHLILSEEVVAGFDSNYKVKPPLRTKADIKALLAGLKDGTIDAIVSQHTPHEIEFKNVEFEIASYGIIGLQTILPLALQAGLTPTDIIEKMAINPRKILRLPIPLIEAGTPANLVLFDTDTAWVFDQEQNRSKSSNTPFKGQTFKGKVCMVFNNNQNITF
jgi:dihydroorotase